MGETLTTELQVMKWDQVNEAVEKYLADWPGFEVQTMVADANQFETFDTHNYTITLVLIRRATTNARTVGRNNVRAKRTIG